MLPSQANVYPTATPFSLARISGLFFRLSPACAAWTPDVLRMGPPPCELKWLTVKSLAFELKALRYESIAVGQNQVYAQMNAFYEGSLNEKPLG